MKENKFKVGDKAEVYRDVGDIKAYYDFGTIVEIISIRKPYAMCIDEYGLEQTVSFENLRKVTK